MTPRDAKIWIEPLGVDALGEIERFWGAASPLHPVTPLMLRRRLLESPGGGPELLLGARGSDGRLLGFASGVFIPEHARFAGVRWLALDPALDVAGEAGRRVAGPLLEELGRRLAARGVEKVRMLGTPPHYFRPGIDARETGLIACLLDLGWKHEATHFNMTCDLARWVSPGEAAIFGADAQGYSVRRARPEDREAFTEYMNRAWTANWRDESLEAFANDPITLFLALKGEAIAGFAAYEVSQCVGGFGPTGVSPEHRGAALGKRVLWACLDALQRTGRAVCEIGWVGPVGFYHRSCGATLGPAYWFLTRDVG